MTLAETLPQKLADWRPAGDGRHSLSQVLGESGWTLHISADRADSVGCLLWEVALARSGSAAAPPELGAWASAVAGTRGLLEPLRVVEVDVLRHEALLRSESPTHRGSQAAYYEIILHGHDRATLRRFRTSAEQSRREQVAFALTHEALVRFVEGVANF